MARRDNAKKISVDKNDVVDTLIQTLENIQNSLFKTAENFLLSNIQTVKSYKEFKKIIKDGGFIKCGWDGTQKTEDIIKKETNATIRCIPFKQPALTKISCIYSKHPAKYLVIFAKAY